MHLRLFSLVLTIALISKFSRVEGATDIAALLKLGIRLALNNLKQGESVTIAENTTWTIPEDLKNITIGTLNLNDAQIYGFETLDIRDISATDIDSEDDYNKAALHVELFLNQIGLSSNYDADIGIIDEIPVYGDGEINLALSEVYIDLSLNVNANDNLSEIFVDGVNLTLQMRDDESYITRFWKNDEASDVVTTIINILEKVLCMFLNYEKDCVSCVISPIAQYAVNSYLTNDIDDELVVNCTCLNDLLDEEAKLEDLLKYFNEGDFISSLSDLRAEYIREVFHLVEDNVLEILDNEGFDMNL